ncbi:sulfotransferase 1C2A isoform X2 [Parasteatoda tepidariorum]|uniref:sulfotransferase 1C2A isoform X2 n=1 Tax=Parasteatoda tepidariorum TaxID=114398 RepID=UPI0039BD6FEA
MLYLWMQTAFKIFVCICFVRIMATPGKESEKTKPKTPFYRDVDGFRIPGGFSEEAFRSALAYKPRSDDLFIVTYPKCGTTWIQHIIGSILREGKPFQTILEFLLDTPFLEMTGAEAAKTMKRPGAIKMHLPFHMTPYSSNAKYIYIARNPKDCLVSFYHHTKGNPVYKFEDGNFDDFFELFMKGEVDCGDYFDTLLSWYEHRNDPNVLFLTYEQLKEDARTCILKIAEFMDPKYKEMLDKNEKILEDVIYHSSFAFMKKHLHKLLTEIADIPKELIDNNPDIPPGLRELLQSSQIKSDGTKMDFVRKGIVGDWKNYFSPAQNARLQKKYEERTIGTNIPELWKDAM